MVLDRLAVLVELEVKLPSPIKAFHEYYRAFYSLVRGVLLMTELGLRGRDSCGGGLICGGSSAGTQPRPAHLVIPVQHRSEVHVGALEFPERTPTVADISPARGREEVGCTRHT